MTLDVVFMGRKPVAARCLEWLVGQSRFKVIGVLTDSHLAVSPTRDIAIQLGIPVFEYESFRKECAKGELHFDLGVSMLFWRILKGDVLGIPAKGCINFHPAPLPEYKGTAGYNLAILEGLDEWGVTAHYMDEGVDTGGIIDIQQLPVDPDSETALSLERKCQGVIEQQFREVMDRVAASEGVLPSTPNVGGRYVSRAEMEHMKKIIPGDDIERKIRAFWFPPYDGAFVEIEGKRYTLVNREILSQLADPSVSSLFTAGSSIPGGNP